MSRVINDNQVWINIKSRINFRFFFPKIPDFDNFYLDMNGIIHACSHVNEGPGDVNVTEEEIFRNIFHYLDVCLIRERKRKFKSFCFFKVFISND
jgi:5'-3' exonuclease